MRSQDNAHADQSQLHAALFPSPKGLDLLLEQLTAGDCPASGLPLLQAVSEKLQRVIFFTPRCKRWNCPTCGPLNARLAAWRASEGCRAFFEAGHRLTFGTITSHPKLSVLGAWWVLPDAWSKLRKRAVRASSSFEFYVVPEPHRSGKVHLHMLATGGLKKKWWKDNAAACGFGYQADAQEVVSVGGVTSYVSKYLTKTLEFSNVPKYTRRVRTSRGWPKLPEPEPHGDWTMRVVERGEQLSELVAVAENRGFSVSIAGSKSAWRLIGADELA